MILLVLASILLVIAMVLLFFSFRKDPETRTKNGKASLSNVPGLKDATVKKDGEDETLLAKLKKVKEECLRLENEAAEAKKKEAALAEELEKVKGWVDKDQSAQEGIKKEVFELQNKLSSKDQEYEREFSLNLTLNKDLRDYKERLQLQEKINQDLLEKVRLLEAQNKGYKEELKLQVQALAEHKNKEKEAEWVSKKEYEALKARLEKIMEADDNPPKQDS